MCGCRTLALLVVKRLMMQITTCRWPPGLSSHHILLNLKANDLEPAGPLQIPHITGQDSVLDINAQGSSLVESLLKPEQIASLCLREAGSICDGIATPGLGNRDWKKWHGAPLYGAY